MKCYSALLLVSLGFPLMGINDGCDGGTEPVDWNPPGTDFSQVGAYPVSVSEANLAAPSGCTLDYILYTPQGAPSAPLIVLSHGFQRNNSVMVDLGTHLASWGFRTVTPNLCHSTPVDNLPAQDADDMIALAASLGAREVIYMGHSAGGMRSVLAGDKDPAAVLYHGLDMVDAGDLALSAAPGYPLTAYGSLGEPSACNANNNGIPFYEGAPGAVALRVVEADHCDFESPTDVLCTGFCQGANDQFDDGTIHQAIFGLATSYVMWQVFEDDAAANWWVPGGETFTYLTDLGLVEAIVL